jgi:hypothetical protein
MKDPSKKILMLITIIIGIVLFIPNKGLSCPIPVFRYALEYWEADHYRLEVFYKQSLTSEEEELVNLLLKASSDKKISANLDVRKIDLQGNTGDIGLHNFDELSPEGRPYLVLKYPRNTGIEEVVWSGTLNRGNIDLLLNSSSRTAIASKLVGDATAVWVLLESGDRRKDQDAYDVLEKTLRRLEQTLVLPDPELWWGNTLGGEKKGPTIKFDIVRVSRNDFREEHLVKMLLTVEDDLKEFESEPIVFPVYGRGIALYAIVGKGINEWNVREAAEFLIGPCSCQVKHLNPGVDLLISMDWDDQVENLTNLNLANPLSGMGDFSNRAAEVKRLLESATLKRLGTGDNRGKNPVTDSERVVYLDIFGNNAKDTPSKKIDEPISPEPVKEMKAVEKEPEKVVQDVMEFNALPEKESPKISFEAVQKKGFNNRFAKIFIGSILIILIGGIFLYWRTNK